MITIYAGKPGAGKSLKMADLILTLLNRNAKWFRKTGNIRKVVTNLQLSEHTINEYHRFLASWTDPAELIAMRDVDIIWDEIATHLDSTQWQNVPLELKRFLQQHRKRGIDIYGTTQNFAMVDISMRRLVDNLNICYKVMGSRNPSPTKPPIKWIWGVIWITDIDPMTFEDDKPKRVGWDWLIISKNLVGVYDTTQEIQVGHYPPLRHIERHCSDPNCGLVKTFHV